MSIIIITNQKGGVGKSNITYLLASNLNSKVAVLDLDPQGSLSQLSSLINDFDIISDPKSIENIQELDYDFIFVDTPPYLSEHLPKLIRLADLIIIPTKAGVFDLLAIKSTVELIEKANKKDKALIVFNMVKPNTTLTADIKKELDEYNIKVAHTMLSDLVVFTRSVLLKGVGSNPKAQKQIDSLTKEVLTALI